MQNMQWYSNQTKSYEKFNNHDLNVIIFSTHYKIIATNWVLDELGIWTC